MDRAVSVESSVHSRVATITLNRPNKLNAMTDAMWRELNEQLVSVEARSDVGVVVLRGAGGNFCAGSDVTTLVGDAPLAERMRVSNGCVVAVHRSRMPTVAIVDGVAAGAGLNLALACDLVVATTTTRLIEVFIRRDLCLDSGGSWLLPRLVGEHRAREFTFLGEEVSADRALQWGLVNWVVEPVDLQSTVNEVCSRLVAANPQALAASKRLLRAAWTTSLDQALEAEIAEQIQVIDSEQAQRQIAEFGVTPDHGDRPAGEEQHE